MITANLRTPNQIAQELTGQPTKKPKSKLAHRPPVAAIAVATAIPV